MFTELMGVVWYAVVSDSSIILLDHVPFISTLLLNSYEGYHLLQAQLVQTVLSQLFAVPVLFLALKIFKDIGNEHTPFSVKHIKRMRIIALILLINSAFVPLSALVLRLLVPDLNFSRGLIIYMIVGAVLFYLLSIIFEHGASLQQQADETL